MKKTSNDEWTVGFQIGRRQVLKDLCGGGFILVFPGLAACAREDDAPQKATGAGGNVAENSAGGSATMGAGSSEANARGTATSASVGTETGTGGSRVGSSASSTAGGAPQIRSTGSTSTMGNGGSSTDTAGHTALSSSNGGQSHDSEWGSAQRGGSTQAQQSSVQASARSGGSGAGGASGSSSSAASSNGNAGRSTVDTDSGTDTAGSDPDFDDAASCRLTTADIEGPFYIDDAEFPDDESLIRTDIREGLPGCEFRLHFRLLNARKACAPIPSAEVYIWHCNAEGYYSGFDGQDPKTPYNGAAERTPDNMERFCRGVQTSDSRGVVSFTTIYPGWYAGRPIHVHLMARFKDATSRLITTQLYFPANFTLEVHQTEPAYQARVAAMPAGSRNPPSGNPAMPTLTHTPGLVVGTLNVIVNSNSS